MVPLHSLGATEVHISLALFCNFRLVIYRFVAELPSLLAFPSSHDSTCSCTLYSRHVYIVDMYI